MTTVPDLTTAAVVTTRVSAIGVELRTDHDPDAALELAIQDASAEVYYFCGRYDPASLADSPVVRKWATDVAVYRLCLLRLDAPPKSVAATYQAAVDQMTRVLEGKAAVPGAAAGKGAAPVVSNYRVVLDRYPSVRVTRPTSTGQADGYKRRVDFGASAADSG